MLTKNKRQYNLLQRWPRNLRKCRKKYMICVWTTLFDLAHRMINFMQISSQTYLWIRSQCSQYLRNELGRPVILLCLRGFLRCGTFSIKIRKVPGKSEWDGLSVWASFYRIDKCFPRLSKLLHYSLEHPYSGWAKAKLQQEWMLCWCFFSSLLWHLLLVSPPVCWETQHSYPSLELFFSLSSLPNHFYYVNIK